MEQLGPESDPIEALRALRAATVEFARKAERPFDGLDTALSKLRSTVANLGTARVARPPPLGEYGREWNEYCRGEKSNLDPRAVRYLCWDADVATHANFQKYLDSSNASLSARSLQGLVRACHLRWSDEFAPGPVVATVRHRVRRYNGRNRVLEKWNSDLPLILGSQGHDRFSELLLSQRSSITESCESWKLDESTAYVLEGVKQVVKNSLEQLNAVSRKERRDPALMTYLCSKILRWERWPDGEFRLQVTRAILSPFAEDGSNGELKTLVVRDPRLGDPRLPPNHPNWVGHREAESRFTEWLSRDDISFFFEYVMPGQHQRKEFWLGYVRKIQRSRPLLSWRHRASLGRLKEKVGNFGFYDHNHTSAFVLDFGSLIAVEFSQKPNACYVYQRRFFDDLVPELWAPTSFSESQLKNKDACVDRITHDVHGSWGLRLRNLLARYGVRPE